MATPPSCFNHVGPSPSGTGRCERLHSTKIESSIYCQSATSTQDSDNEPGSGEVLSAEHVHAICWRISIMVCVHADTVSRMQPSSTSTCRRRRPGHKKGLSVPSQIDIPVNEWPSRLDVNPSFTASSMHPKRSSPHLGHCLVVYSDIVV